MELFIVVSTLIMAIVIFFSLNRSNDKVEGKPLRLPPGTLGGWPLIGDTIAFMRPHPSASLGTFLDQNIAKHGRIFKMNLFGKPTIVSADVEFNRLILQSEGRLFESSCPTSVAEVVGRSSMLAVTGDVHRELRSIVVSFMSNARLRACFLPGIDAQAVGILDSWKDGSTLSAQEEGKKFAFNLMVKHLMNMDPETVETERLREEYGFFMKGMASIPLNLPGTAFRKALQARAAILKIMGQKLDERARRINEEGRHGRGLEADDLLESVAKHPSITREQTLDLILGMLFAGHETSSAAISLAIYFLSSSPRVLQQLREEHTKIAEKKKERGLSWDDYRQMEFTHCVINETLRLGNIVKFLNRKAISDVQFKGYDIPCGWEVVPIISAAHLDESVYDDPQTYNPWRWKTILATASKSSSVMSFSGGPRLCPGAELAKLEMAVFLHHLVRRFDWEPAVPDHPVSFPFLGFPKHLPIKLRALHK